MASKTPVFLFFFILPAFCLNAIAQAPDNRTPASKTVTERSIKAEILLKIGSARANEDFYKPPTFAVGKNGQIYILDSGNSRIQCFSKDGSFLFGFGRRGQGPGELSPDARKIKILSDGNIYVIDNSQRRINVYNQEGKFIRLAKISAWYNDIVLLNNTYFLSNFRLEEKHKPIHAARSLEKIDTDFGIFVEPAVGILNQIKALPMPEPWRVYYSDANFTRLAVINKNDLIFSQGYPYRLIKYDANGTKLKDLVGDVDFDTFQHVKFTRDSSGTSISTYPPGGAWILLDVSVTNENQVVVPYLNPEESLIHVDFYDSELDLISRYRISNTIADLKKEDYVWQIMIDGDKNLYAVVISKEDYPKLIKYRLLFN